MLFRYGEKHCCINQHWPSKICANEILTKVFVRIIYFWFHINFRNLNFLKKIQKAIFLETFENKKKTEHICKIKNWKFIIIIATH